MTKELDSDTGLADKGHDSAQNRAALEKRGASDGTMRRIRAKCPPPIRALKRWRRLGRAVYTGIVRFREQVSLAILAHNLLKAVQRRQSRTWRQVRGRQRTANPRRATTTARNRPPRRLKRSIEEGKCGSGARKRGCFQNEEVRRVRSEVPISHK